MEIYSYSPYNARIKISTVVYQPLTDVRPPVRGVGCESRAKGPIHRFRSRIPDMKPGFQPSGHANA